MRRMAASDRDNNDKDAALKIIIANHVYLVLRFVLALAKCIKCIRKGNVEMAMEYLYVVDGFITIMDSQIVNQNTRTDLDQYYFVSIAMLVFLRASAGHGNVLMFLCERGFPFLNS